MRPIKGYEFRLAIEQAVTKFSLEILKKKMNVYWLNDNAASVNDGEIRLPNVPDDINLTHGHVESYTAWLLHEMLHLKYTSMGVSAKGKYSQELLNAIEDAWIERRAIKENTTGNIEQVLTKHANKMVDQSMMSVSDWTDPKQYPFALAMYAREFCKVPPLAGGLEEIFEKATRMLDTSNGTKDNLRISQWVFDQLNLPPEMDAPQAEQQKSEKNQDGEHGDGDGQDGEDDEDGDDSEEARKIVKVGKRRKPNENSKAQEVSHKVEQFQKSQTTEGFYSKDALLTSRDNHLTKAVRFKNQKVGGARIRYEVRRLFEMSGLDEWQINRRSGSLNVNALHTVNTGNDKVFKRHLEEDGIDSAVVLILDISGSMYSEDFIQSAVQVTSTMMETLASAGVATALLTFGSSTAVMKPFNMPVKKAIEDILRVKEGGSTNDYFAVRYAHELLLQRRERRKITFVITDGEGDVHTTKKQVKTGEALGITTIGLGIGTNVSNVYPKAVRINNINDLANATFKHIKLAA